MVTIRFETAGTRPSDLPAAFRQYSEAVLTAGMKGVAEGMLLEMRRHIAGRLSGRSAPTLITGKGYPDRPGQTSIRAAAVVRARGYNAADIIRGQEQGGTIVPRAARFLIIPTGAAGRFGGRRLTLREAEAKFGKKALAYIPSRHGAGGVVVLLDAFARAGTAKAARRERNRGLSRRDEQRGRAVVLFVVRPRVSSAKRLDLTGIAQKWAEQAPRVLEAAATALEGSRYGR